MFGAALMSFDYVSTMHLGENKVGYAQRKFAENFLWLIEVERYFPPENVKKTSNTQEHNKNIYI